MKRIWLVLGGVAMAFAAYVAIIVVLWFSLLKRSPFYTTCLQFARTAPELIRLVGPIVSTSYLPFGFYEESTEDQVGNGTVVFTVRGERQRGVLRISAYRRFDHWVIEHARIRIGAESKDLETAGEVIARLGEMPVAEQRHLIERLRLLQPSIPEPYYLIGEYYLDMKEHAEAERAFREAIGKDGSYAPAYNDLGVTLMGMKRYPDALKMLAKAATLAPEDAYPYINQATIYIASDDLRNLPHARMLLKEATDRSPDEPLIYDVEADLNRLEEKWEAAAASAAQARRLREEVAQETAPPDEE